MSDLVKITVPDVVVAAAAVVTVAAGSSVAGGAVVWISVTVVAGAGVGAAGGACVDVQPAVQSRTHRKIPMQRRAVFECMGYFLIFPIIDIVILM